MGSDLGEPARCAGRTDRRDQQQEGELHTGRRHSVVLHGGIQEWVVRFLKHRIGDKRIIRLVQKWLRAGILEDGVMTIEEKGTGQGSVISPLLANVYLHYVFDLWAERWRRREAKGDVIMVRYADDTVVGFNMRPTPDASGMRCAKGCGSSRCRYIRTRRDLSSSAALRRRIARSAGLGNRIPSSSWALCSSAASPGAATSKSGGSHVGIA